MKIKENKILFTDGIIVVLLIILSTVWNIHSAQKQTHIVTESITDFYMEEIIKRRVSIITDVLKQNYQYMTNAIDSISREDLSSITSLRNYLGKIRRLYGVEKFSFVDEDCLIYTAHSTSPGKTRYPFLAKGLTGPLATTVLNYGGEKLLFIALPVTGITFNGKKITACFAQVNIDQMVRSMTFRAENMETYFNVYLKNGESLTAAPFGGVEPGRNILSVIQENDESKVSYNKIKNDFLNEKQGSIHVPYRRQNAHLYYAPVEETGWMLSILVYDSVISSEIKNGSKTIIALNNLQIFITLTSVIILFAIFVITLNKNSRLMIEQEKKIAAETKKAYDKLNIETQGMQIIHSIIHSGPWSMEFNEKGEIEKCVWSVPFRQMLGYMTEEEFPNTLEAWANLLHPDDKERVWKAYWNSVNDYTGKTMYDVEYRLLTKNKGYRWYHAAGNLIRREDGSPQTYVGLFIDIDEKKSLKTLSETDQMTGLLNRISGENKVAESLKKGNGGLFILLDVDHFKFINDTFGHGVGDKVIISVANCLKTAFRDNDIVFRLGGDEFSAYAQTIHNKPTAEKVISRFIDGLKKISIPELKGHSIEASIGAVVMNTEESADFALCYKLADEGVYDSKKIDGRSAVTFRVLNK
jgi:diguanylate cyclase (GGDEF)-like protein